MKKTEFQKYAYSEVNKLFLELFMQGKVKKYSSEAKGDRQKLKYEPEFQRSLAVYFFRNGTIRIYQRGDFGQSVDNAYYEWREQSDFKDVAAALTKDLTAFLKRLNDGGDELSMSWGHDSFCDFAYETPEFRKPRPEPGEA